MSEVVRNNDPEEDLDQFEEKLAREKRQERLKIILCIIFLAVFIILSFWLEPPKIYGGENGKDQGLFFLNWAYIGNLDGPGVTGMVYKKSEQELVWAIYQERTIIRYYHIENKIIYIFVLKDGKYIQIAPPLSIRDLGKAWLELMYAR